jgi:hypothetical protein
MSPRWHLGSLTVFGPRSVTVCSSSRFHAANELDDDEISILDVEEIILTGDIIQRQRDPQTRERKYVIRGGTLAGEAACCVVKIGPTGQVVLVTAWVE